MDVGLWDCSEEKTLPYNWRNTLYSNSLTSHFLYMMAPIPYCLTDGLSGASAAGLIVAIAGRMKVLQIWKQCFYITEILFTGRISHNSTTTILYMRLMLLQCDNWFCFHNIVIHNSNIIIWVMICSYLETLIIDCCMLLLEHSFLHLSQD